MTTDAEMLDAVARWIQSRNALSADCVAMGIGSSSADTPAWQAELLRREEPLRRAANDWFYKRPRGDESQDTTAQPGRSDGR